MAILEVKNDNPAGAIQDLLHSMLTQRVVSAVLVPQEVPSEKTVIQTLVRDPAKLNGVNPLAPVLGVNSARIIMKMCIGQMPKKDQGKNEDEQASTKIQSCGAPIAVVLRPCEIRALVELVKLQQVSMEPFLVVGVDCWGTYSVQDYAAKVDKGSQNYSVTAEFLKQVTAGSLPQDLRGACQGCQYPAPTCVDLAIQLIGEDVNKQIRVQAHTQKGKAVFEALQFEDTPESDKRKDALDRLKEVKKQLSEHDQTSFLEMISSLCINCHNCRAVCPICYCKQCVFEGEIFEYPLDKYLSWSDKKGVLPMPPDKLLFHLTRMSHVAMSCVGCGQCEAACPSAIPLGRVYQKISRAAQEALDYEAGRSLDEELPLAAFREDELSVVED